MAEGMRGMHDPPHQILQHMVIRSMSRWYASYWNAFLLILLLPAHFCKVVAKVVFLYLFVILFTGGCLPQCMLGCHTPKSRHPPPRADTLQDQTATLEQTPPGVDTPPRADTSPRADSPPGSRLRHTVNERPVRILLECILVIIIIIIIIIIYKVKFSAELVV